MGMRRSVRPISTGAGVTAQDLLISEDGTRAGGVYLWKSREDADALYPDRWKQMIRDKYGSDPVIS